MIQVIEGKIIQYSLPKTGVLKDGRTVSGYHLLDEETLLEEGWLPLEDVEPEYDEETQYLVQDGYEILEDKVIFEGKVYESLINGNTWSPHEYPQGWELITP